MRKKNGMTTRGNGCAVKGFAKGGAIDGCASKGKTAGKMVKMAGGGMCGMKKKRGM